MQKRHGVPVRSGDRDSSTAGRHRPRERDRSWRGRPHGFPRLRGKVNTAMLSCSVRIVSKTELLQQRSLDRPGPGGGGRSADQERSESRQQESELTHRRSSLLSLLQTKRA